MSTEPRRSAVPPAEHGDIVSTQSEAAIEGLYTDGPLPHTSGGYRKNAAGGFVPTVSASERPSPTSVTSAAPSRPSTKLWRTPRNVREFASQANEVASMVLNGDMDVNVARIYSGLARTVAQAMSTEVSRARFLSELPDLSFVEETDADE